MTNDDLLRDVEHFFSDKVKTHGPNPAGADYNSESAQQVRFDQLLKVIDRSAPFSLNDYGCGYGALAHYMVTHGYQFRYAGFDISEPMIEEARKLPNTNPDWLFTTQLSDLTKQDYTIACGVFNLKFKADAAEWQTYVLESLHILSGLSIRGFSFNMLTGYSDPEKMRPDLYYPDPCFIFDYCKRNFSRNVALLHDYELYDFTIIVRLSG